MFISPQLIYESGIASSNLMRSEALSFCLFVCFNKEIKVRKKCNLIKVTLLLSSDTRFVQRPVSLQDLCSFINMHCMPEMWPRVVLAELAVFGFLESDFQPGR